MHKSQVVLEILYKVGKHLHADPKPEQIKEESQLCPIAGEGSRGMNSLSFFQTRKCALNPLRMSCCHGDEFTKTNWVAFPLTRWPSTLDSRVPTVALPCIS